MKYDCLIVDDEQDISLTVSEYFNMFDIKTAYATNYKDGMNFLSSNNVSILLLDVNIGNDSGFLFCKELRKHSDMPILFISARQTEQDILSGLSLGGDDYITKPFTMSILLAKVKAMLKRTVGVKEPVISASGLHIDSVSAKAYKNGEQITLKPMEWKLLQYFIEHPNCLLTKDELLENVWNDTFINEGTLSVHVRHLREKIEDDPNEPKLIKTVWGMGYRYEDIT